VFTIGRQEIQFCCASCKAMEFSIPQNLKKLSQHLVFRPLKPDLIRLGMTNHWSFIICIQRILSCIQWTPMMMMMM